MERELRPAPSLESGAAFTSIAAYRFVGLEDIGSMRPVYQEICRRLGLVGTILLAPEGINLFLAGRPSAVASFLTWLRSDPRLSDIEVKTSTSDQVPFKRMLVKLKKEIITMRMPLIRPESGRAPSVDPKTLKRWLDAGHDDAGRPVVVMDTRNAFEVDVGTFEGAIDFCIAKFTEFPPAVDQATELRDKTVVTFCTGGIRCEKAAIYMKDIGFRHVYQLDGGILKYFEEVGGTHFRGDCFVFDQRTALNPDLEPTKAVQCFACRAVVTPKDQASPLYVPGASCPRCG